MGTFERQYKVFLSDFREANYYILFLRKRTGFRLAAIVLLAFFVYVVLCRNDVLPFEPFAAFIACAELIWALLQLSKVERQIRTYAKSENNLLNVEYHARFGAKQYTIDIPERKFHFCDDIEKLEFAFEITHCFLLYATGEQLFILPTRDMSKEDSAALRGILSDALGSRFSSLFAKKK